MPRRVRKSVLGSQTSAAAGTPWDPEDWDPTDPARSPLSPRPGSRHSAGHPRRPHSSRSRSSIGILLRRLVEGEEKSWSCGCWIVFLPKWLGPPAWGPTVETLERQKNRKVVQSLLLQRHPRWTAPGDHCPQRRPTQTVSRRVLGNLRSLGGSCAPRLGSHGSTSPVHPMTLVGA